MRTHLNQIYSGHALGSVSEGSAGERRETVRTAEALPDPEVSGRPHRRTFTAKYKSRILEEIGKGDTPVGRILRREGLYFSQVAAWRKTINQQNTVALEPKARGPQPKPVNPLAAEIVELRRKTIKLEKKLRQAELRLDFQKKVSQLLGITLPIFEDESEEKDPGESENYS